MRARKTAALSIRFTADEIRFIELATEHERDELEKTFGRVEYGVSNFVLAAALERARQRLRNGRRRRE